MLYIQRLQEMLEKARAAGRDAAPVNIRETIEAELKVQGVDVSSVRVKPGIWEGPYTVTVFKKDEWWACFTLRDPSYGGGEDKISIAVANKRPRNLKDWIRSRLEESRCPGN